MHLTVNVTRVTDVTEFTLKPITSPWLIAVLVQFVKLLPLAYCALESVGLVPVPQMLATGTAPAARVISRTIEPLTSETMVQPTMVPVKGIVGLAPAFVPVVIGVPPLSIVMPKQ